MLSIIIITKNEEERLPRLLSCIQNQNFTDYEVIVSDAASTDKTRKIANTYGCKIVEGGLPSVGRNNGAKIANGNILLFLDADAYWNSPEFLNKNLTELDSRKIGIATTFFKPMSTKIIDRFFFWIFNSFFYFLQYLNPHSIGICIFCRKEIFEKNKGFNEKLLLGEDCEFVKRAGKINKFRILKSAPMHFDLRRWDKEGRLKLIPKYIYGLFHRIIIGEQYKPKFKYELNGGVEVMKVYEEIMHHTKK